MTLLEIIKTIKDLDENNTIYALKPWQLMSKAVVCKEPEDGSLPNEAEGMNYFLEVFLAKEFIEDWPELPNKTPEQICNRIISYAINDA